MAIHIGQLTGKVLGQKDCNAVAKRDAALQRRCDAVIERYGDFNGFMERFNKDMQEQAGMHIDAVFKGTAPTLSLLNQVYGNDSASTFVACHLNVVQNFCGIQKKLTIPELMEISKVIVAGFFYLKTSELCLFFLWFKIGKYGKFYGCIDPLVITNALQQFAKERAEYIDKYESEKRMEELQKLRERKNAITFNEYKKLIKDERQSKCKGEFFTEESNPSPP